MEQAAIDLLDEVDPIFREADWKERFFAQDRFIATRIAPRVRILVEPVVARIIEDASRSLALLTTDMPAFDDIEEVSAAPPLADIAEPAVTLPEPEATTAMAKLWADAEERLRRKGARYIRVALIKGSRKQPSILDQLTLLFNDRAARAKRSQSPGKLA